MSGHDDETQGSEDEAPVSGETATEEHAEDEAAGGPPTRRMLEEEQPQHVETEPHIPVAVPSALDVETTLNLSSEELDQALRDDSSPLATTMEAPTAINQGTLGRDHLKGLLEALIFASDKPLKPGDLARSAAAPVKEVKLLLAILKQDYLTHGIQLDEVAGGWIFRTSVAFAPFVRDMASQKPVRLSRAQVETLAILAYRQPVTRPEIDDVRGVDCGATLKLLLERDLVRILGKKDEPGRPLLYGTTSHFLEFFGLNSLKDLPTLREYTELNEDSRRTVEKELGETLDASQPIGLTPKEAPPVEQPTAEDEHAPDEHAEASSETEEDETSSQAMKAAEANEGEPSEEEASGDEAEDDEDEEEDEEDEDDEDDEDDEEEDEEEDDEDDEEEEKKEDEPTE